MLLVIKGFFAIESSGIMNLVAKIGIQIKLKGYLPIQESFWQKHFAFLSAKNLVEYVQCALATRDFSHLHFGSLDVKKGAHDMFVVVVNFLLNDWEPKHITIKLFEDFNIFGATMVI